MTAVPSSLATYQALIKHNCFPSSEMGYARARAPHTGGMGLSINSIQLFKVLGSLHHCLPVQYIEKYIYMKETKLAEFAL